MFKKGSIGFTIWNAVVAALFITLGIVFCVNASNPDFQNVIILIAGIFVIVDAALRLLTQVIHVVRIGEATLMGADIASAAAGASELAVGIMLIFVSQGQSAFIIELMRYLALFIGILLITIGTVALIYAIVFLVKKAGVIAQNVAFIIFGALLITGGTLILVFANNEGMTTFFFVVFGLFYAFAGIVLLFSTIALFVIARRAAKELKTEEPIKEDAVIAEPVEEKPAEEEKAEEPSEEKPEEPKEE